MPFDYYDDEVADSWNLTVPVGAQRYNSGKRKVGLFVYSTLDPTIKVLEYGAHKYSIFLREDGSQVKGADITPEESKGLTVIREGGNNWRAGK